MESGESAAQACEREVWEETGLKVRVTRLIGVYSNPDQLVIYPDGNKAFFVVLSFEAEIISGELGLSEISEISGTLQTRAKRPGQRLRVRPFQAEQRKIRAPNLQFAFKCIRCFVDHVGRQGRVEAGSRGFDG